jgi:O-antigen ligase
MLLTVIALASVAGEAYETAGVQGTIVLSAIVTIALGGFVAALVARRAPLKHALALGIVMALVGVLNMYFSSGDEAVWLQVTQILVAVPAALAGGALRAWQRGSAADTTGDVPDRADLPGPD